LLAVTVEPSKIGFELMQLVIFAVALEKMNAMLR
jgi:hypothetical protein